MPVKRGIAWQLLQCTACWSVHRLPMQRMCCAPAGQPRGGLSDVQATPAVPPISTVRPTIRRSRRDRPDTRRHPAMQRNVEAGQLLLSLRR
jgi:hypothetical protein